MGSSPLRIPKFSSLRVGRLALGSDSDLRTVVARGSESAPISRPSQFPCSTGLVASLIGTLAVFVGATQRMRRVRYGQGALAATAGSARLFHDRAHPSSSPTG